MTGAPDDQGAGYGKPPASRRWHKGKSGNSRKHRKRQWNKLVALDELLLKRMMVTGPGGPQRLPAIQLILRHLAQKEAAGSKRALLLRLKYEAVAAAMHSGRAELLLAENDYTRSLRRGDEAKEGHDDP